MDLLGSHGFNQREKPIASAVMLGVMTMAPNQFGPDSLPVLKAIDHQPGTLRDDGGIQADGPYLGIPLD